MQSRTVRAPRPFAPVATLAVIAALAWSPQPLAAGDVVVDGSFVSTVPTGTAPLDVSSTTRVDDLNADLLDGIDSSALARSLGNVLRVGKTGGDFTSIQAALDSVTGSAGSPYLVLVGPGVFDEHVQMKQFIDIQGSGEGVTVITQAGSVSPDFGTVAGADGAELRHLTVANRGGTSNIAAIYNGEVSPRLSHVTVEVEASAAASAYGILNESAPEVPTAPELDHVTVRVVGTGDVLAVVGVTNETEANTRMSHVRVSVEGSSDAVKYGVFNGGAAPVLDDVEVTVASSESSASVFGVVNQNADDAVLRSMRVVVTGGGTRYGVNNSTSDVTIRDLEVNVSGDGSASYGVWDEDCTAVLESCSIAASGGSALTVGVYKVGASGEVRDCTVTADGGTIEYAVRGFDSTGTASAGTYAIDVQHSRLRGGLDAVDASSAFDVRVGASQLDGGISGTAAYTCAASYDGAFAALGTSCT